MNKLGIVREQSQRSSTRRQAGDIASQNRPGLSPDATFDDSHKEGMPMTRVGRAFTVHIHPTVSELIPTRAISSHWKPD